jgi:hypothetical protein
MQARNRRTFMLQIVATPTVLVAGGARADEPVRLTETDAYARSMGFRLDTAQVDQTKFPRHTVEQHCSKCQLFSGKTGEPVGPCSFYGGRLVPINGWCRNFKVRKAEA